MSGELDLEFAAFFFFFSHFLFSPARAEKRVRFKLTVTSSLIIIGFNTFYFFVSKIACSEAEANAKVKNKSQDSGLC